MAIMIIRCEIYAVATTVRPRLKSIGQVGASGGSRGDPGVRANPPLDPC